jgi:hypothetical protein
MNKNITNFSEIFNESLFISNYQVVFHWRKLPLDTTGQGASLWMRKRVQNIMFDLVSDVLAMQHKVKRSNYNKENECEITITGTRQACTKYLKKAREMKADSFEKIKAGMAKAMRALPMNKRKHINSKELAEDDAKLAKLQGGLLAAGVYFDIFMRPLQEENENESKNTTL